MSGLSRIVSLIQHPRRASEVMRNLNANMLIAQRGMIIVGIEDHDDEPGGKLYRLEYRSSLDAQKAVARVLHNPWDPRRPNAGTNEHQSHVSRSGIICVGNGAVPFVWMSPFDLDFTIKRARFWCTAFSHWRATGDGSVFRV